MTVLEVSNTKPSEEEMEKFEENLNDKNKKAITHVITLELTDFVDMQEFNSMQISAGEFEKKQAEYLKEHSKASEVDKLAHEFMDKLAELGLFKETLKVSARPFDVGRKLLNELSNIMCGCICDSEEQDSSENNEQEETQENTDSQAH